MFTKWKYNRKQMRSIDAKHSPIMKDLMKKKKIASILERKAEQREFFQALKEQAKKEGGGITVKGMRAILGKFRKGQGKNIDRGEAIDLASELTDGKYLFEKDKSASEEVKSDQPNQDSPRSPFKLTGSDDQMGFGSTDPSFKNSRFSKGASIAKPRF